MKKTNNPPPQWGRKPTAASSEGHILKKCLRKQLDDFVNEPKV